MFFLDDPTWEAPIVVSLCDRLRELALALEHPGKSIQDFLEHKVDAVQMLADLGELAGGGGPAGLCKVVLRVWK